MVQGVGFRVQGSGCRVKGSGCRVEGGQYHGQRGGARCGARAPLLPLFLPRRIEDDSSVDILGVWYKFVNFWGGMLGVWYESVIFGGSKGAGLEAFQRRCGPARLPEWGGLHFLASWMPGGGARWSMEGEGCATQLPLCLPVQGYLAHKEQRRPRTLQ